MCKFVVDQIAMKWNLILEEDIKRPKLNLCPTRSCTEYKRSKSRDFRGMEKI